MFNEHKIKGKLKISEFSKLIIKYDDKNIEATGHTFFRLSEKQRKIYTEEELKKIISNDKPIEIGIQNNGNYSVIYNYKEKYLKILLDFTPNKIYIVTFYILNREQEKDIGK
jgi:hypothetical protein